MTNAINTLLAVLWNGIANEWNSHEYMRNEQVVFDANNEYLAVNAQMSEQTVNILYL